MEKTANPPSEPTAQMPEPSARTKCQKAAKSNTRKQQNQIPDQMPELLAIDDGAELEGIFELLNQIPENAGYQMPDEARGTLWRIEKDGKGSYQWRLRFSRKRVWQPAGKIAAEISEALATRRGKGNHAASRAEAKRFRSEVERLENLFAAGRERGRKMQSRKRKRQSGDRAGKRQRVHSVPRVASRELPDVSTSSLIN